MRPEKHPQKRNKGTKRGSLSCALAITTPLEVPVPRKMSSVDPVVIVAARVNNGGGDGCVYGRGE